MLNMIRGGRASLIVGVVVWFTTAALAEGPLKFRDSQFEPIKWSELAGWTADDHLAAYTAYQASCQALLKSRRSDGGEELPRALSNVCRKAGIRPQDTYTARAFFEQNFQPLRIGRLGEAEGLLTGYFEPIVAGSASPVPSFMSRSTAGRATWKLLATSSGLRRFRIKGCASAAVTRTTSSCRTTTAPP